MCLICTAYYCCWEEAFRSASSMIIWCSLIIYITDIRTKYGESTVLPVSFQRSLIANLNATLTMHLLWQELRIQFYCNYYGMGQRGHFINIVTSDPPGSGPAGSLPAAVIDSFPYLSFSYTMVLLLQKRKTGSKPTTADPVSPRT